MLLCTIAHYEPLDVSLQLVVVVFFLRFLNIGEKDTSWGLFSPCENYSMDTPHGALEDVTPW